ncbi:ferritin subunit [Coccinella septempunctata]|uniref:ferritin subunit n=1 Tax=Coccinella septempunctata TaxID=41139 RepID=UPI001D0936A4|nr:ferritin subunit [Coccinella septempunctata]
MRFFTVFSFFAIVICATTGQHCTTSPSNVPKTWIDMVSPCVQSVRAQIQEEMNASMKYLAMGAHFSRDTINRPGFAKLFFKAASEEREHAIKLINYLLMRGELVSNVSKLIKTTINVPNTYWKSGTAALEDALETEAYVTKKIRSVIASCDNPNDGSGFIDYHLSDYLTGDFLDEQYKGQKELADKLSQLQKLMGKHGHLGEFLFDKKLL